MTRFVPILCSLLLAGQMIPSAVAAEPELNFKIYSPQAAPKAKPAPASDTSAKPAESEPESTPAKVEEKSSDSMWSTDSSSSTDTAPSSGASTPAAEPLTTGTTETPTADPVTETAPTTPAAESSAAPTEEKKVLQGYIRVVPSGTKIPIIMDTAVDSDTSQEGDEFAARTGEDLNIDGSTVVPAGSVIKGRIAQINAPKSLNRSGSVALKFDTVTTPDNRQIPIVANLVARGGVVHARRGLKDIAMDTGTFMAPTVIGLGIGVLAGGSGGSGSSGHIGRAGGALIGAGVGAAVGVAILCIKKGKKIDVRPGDELKIELAEDLRMPM
jgi:hypothetical protein